MVFTNRFSSCAARSILFACVMVGIPSGHALADPSEPALAPAFELRGINEIVSLEQHRGSVVYVDFWASWCKPCMKSFPWMNELQERHADKGLKVIAINLDSNPADAKSFLEATRPNFVIAYDPEGQTANDYQVRGMPSSYIIGRDGKLVWQHIGFRKKDTGKLEQQLIAALEGR